MKIMRQYSPEFIGQAVNIKLSAVFLTLQKFVKSADTQFELRRTCMESAIERSHASVCLHHDLVLVGGQPKKSFVKQKMLMNSNDRKWR